MKPSLRNHLVWLAPLAALVMAIAIPNCAQRPPPVSRITAPDGTRFGVTLAQRRTYFSQIAQNDSRWRAIAESTFPGDVWAQADHWSDHMSQFVRMMAVRLDVSVVSILLAYDEGLHEGWRGPGNKALRTSWPPLTKHQR